MSKKIKNVRQAALEILEAIEKQQSYSNLLLNRVIQKHQIDGPDVALLTEITYGTIQRKLTLDYYLKPFLPKKLEHWILLLLRMSLYQMIYLDKIPDHAILYESVEIAKRRGHGGIARLVNGILRSIQRNGTRSLEEITDPLERLSIETSHPLWLVKRWVEQFGFEQTRLMCLENLLAPVQTARVNTMKTTREKVISELESEGYSVQPSPIIPVSIRILKGNVAFSKAFRDGLLTIQDESSMVVAYAMEINANMNILDACAAPGGKTTHIAEFLNGTGKVVALDLHKHKMKLIMENANRLDLENIENAVADSRDVSNLYQTNSFDRVLVDAPCSGFGVLRRKPEIKYNKSLTDLKQLHKVQLQILNESAKMVKHGGLLVYSTCTVDHDENMNMAKQFLQDHPDFKGHDLNVPEAFQSLKDRYTLQIFPQDFGGDGFFIACFEKY